MTMMVRFFGFLAFLFFSALAANAQESITSFDVDIEARQNGDLLITETITVNVEGRQIRRGILRELPYYQLFEGEKIPVRYKVRSVDRNDRREPFVIEKQGNAMVMRIGDADYFLQHKQHKYEISYLIKDDLRRDNPDFDEVYWNVTGNFWRLPIERASARVFAPEGVRLQGVDIYTGREGAVGKDAEFSERSDHYYFESTRRFETNEGLTISLQFDKGVFGDVQESTRRYIFNLRYLALILLSVSFLGIAGYYYMSWNKVGRDPVKGAVFARYEPPKDYSPAAASYIYYRGVRGHKALIATLIGLANKNWISIETDKKMTILTPLDRDIESKDQDDSFGLELGFETLMAIVSGDKNKLKQQGLDIDPEEDGDRPDDTVENRGNLNEEESYLFSRLFPSTLLSPIVLKKSVNSHFNTAHALFQSSLRRHYGSEYYKINMRYIMLGIFLSVAAIIVTVSQISNLTSRWIFALIGLLVAVNLLFIYLMPAPTQKGQKIRTEIEGFRLFMKTAEKQKFDAVDIGSDQPPPMSVDRYEQLLPYAIALDVEEPWSRYFEKVMPVEAKDYDPAWGGSLGRRGGLSSMTENMVSNISSGVSSAAPKSSSSSGSGGGGFSGGGGGGGGGGGW